MFWQVKHLGPLPIVVLELTTAASWCQVTVQSVACALCVCSGFLQGPLVSLHLEKAWQ